MANVTVALEKNVKLCDWHLYNYSWRMEFCCTDIVRCCDLDGGGGVKCQEVVAFY